MLLIAITAQALAQLKLGVSTDNLLEPEKAFRLSARALDAPACASAPPSRRRRSLATHFQIEATRAVHQDADAHLLAIGLDLAEERRAG